MINSFLIGVISFGLVLAIIQDIKRREIDNWLNLLIFISGAIYLILKSLITKEYLILIYFLITFVGVFLLANILYYSNIFAGGDYHLLIALTPLFVTNQIKLVFSNIILFLILLIFSGSIYGLLFLIFLYFKNFKKIKEEIRKEFIKNKIKLFLVLSILTTPLTFINNTLILVPILLLITPVLFSIAKILQEKVLTKKINVKDLKQGDWLASNIKIKNRIIKSDFKGISLKELELIQKSKKSVTIKEGIPFAPAFAIAFVCYLLFKDNLITYLLFLF
ncbi:MAG: A24 family peptidase [Candidatus Pacearchaeota archaeon]